MKELFTVLCATALIFVGLAASVFCAYQMFLGQWAWFLLLLGAFGILFSGIQIARGERPGEVVKDLLFILAEIR